MEQQSILITGCSTGIGHCLAHGLNKSGFRVFATARKDEDVARLIDEGLESFRLDLADSASVQAGAQEALSRANGRLYALINNGAYGQAGAVEDLSREVLRTQFETNVFGSHELACAVLPSMRDHNEGRIIQISSVLGFVSLAYRGAYNASKYALTGLTDTMRHELHGSNIHVVLIEPGPITSRFRENSLAAFRTNIDADASAHAAPYKALLKRLEGRNGPMPFTLPPEAVLAKVTHALNAKRPRIRYGVTFPTHLFRVLKRLLPVRAMDWVLFQAGDSAKLPPARTGKITN